MGVEELLTTANAALRRGSWREARDLLERAVALEPSPEALEALGTACWWLDDQTAVFEAREQAYRLAVQTARGASELAKQSPESAETLRQRVTSKGGTTHEAITTLEAGGLKPLFEKAMQACARRARELGAEFGND